RMRTLSLVLTVLFVPESGAIECFEYDNLDDTRGGQCCGDFCYTTRYNSTNRAGEAITLISKTGCLRGEIYERMINKCWDDRLISYCICNGDYCNGNHANFPGWNNNTLKCDEDERCVACEQDSYVTGFEERGCRQQASKSIEWLMQPQSCVRFERSTTENYVECLCDTGNNCDKKLISEQKLKSNAVTCMMQGDDTCKGDFCYITKLGENKPGWETIEDYRGCITNNETLFPRLYQAGYFTFIGDEFVVCKTDKCNANWEKAKDSVPENEPFCPMTITTEDPSGILDREFQYKWMNMFDIIGDAFNDIIIRFTGF
ncbi:hypothetical protein PENTCL1PPCAC_8527, partial [Pristionchus entomophagus]